MTARALIAFAIMLAPGALAQSEWNAGLSGLLASREAMQLFEDADCVIAVGAGLNQRTLAGGYVKGQSVACRATLSDPWSSATATSSPVLVLSALATIPDGPALLAPPCPQAP